MIVKYQKPGEMLPRGYGVAYRRFDVDDRVCYPIPLNVVVFLAREVYFIVAFPVRFSVIDRLISWAWDKGFQHGFAEGGRFHENSCDKRLVEAIEKAILR